ncbi:hypothetical protein PHET_11138 [Paragonimus heterotremus]|uniref:Uncharacterized protein n=1 Tax=Paragonimus heterotremus TaxID=100268 RepID=A0A8J4SFU0_9TREM|nr:hypothetical protein PHET_11138 [Paragonimus heterotremus]
MLFVRFMIWFYRMVGDRKMANLLTSITLPWPIWKVYAFVCKLRKKEPPIFCFRLVEVDERAMVTSHLDQA